MHIYRNYIFSTFYKTKDGIVPLNQVKLSGMKIFIIRFNTKLSHCY
jgi:hypothetical protein